MHSKNFITTEDKLKFLHEKSTNWYGINGRKFPWRDKISWQKLLIVELLLQRTNANKILAIYYTFFNYFTDLSKLCSASNDELIDFIYPLGLQKIRAKHLRIIACELINCEYLPEISDLIRIKGIGIYIANATHCFYLQKRVPLLDTNFKRVYSRYFGWIFPKFYHRNRNALEAAQKILPFERCDLFNYAIIDLSALVCKPNKPLCSSCPLVEMCFYFKAQQ